MIHTVLILYGNSFIAPFCHQQSQSLILKHPFASQKVLSLKITSASQGRAQDMRYGYSKF